VENILNTYKPGDIVIVLQTIKDAYGETWYNIGDSAIIDHIASDGEGLYFTSGLGIHYSKVRLDVQFYRDSIISKIID
jgi:hypothetical protein